MHVDHMVNINETHTYDYMKYMKMKRKENMHYGQERIMKIGFN